MKDVAYGQFLCTVQPEKSENIRTGFTVGGDRINHPVKVATPTANIMVSKVFFNSVESTRGEIFMTIYISNFCLMTPLKRPEYICLKLTDTPKYIIDEYSLLKNPLQMVPSTLNQTKGFMGSLRLTSYPTSCSTGDSANRDSSKASLCQEYGSMIGVPSNSRKWLMVLALNISTRSMRFT